MSIWLIQRGISHRNYVFALREISTQYRGYSRSHLDGPDEPRDGLEWNISRNPGNQGKHGERVPPNPTNPWTRNNRRRLGTSRDTVRPIGTHTVLIGTTEYEIHGRLGIRVETRGIVLHPKNNTLRCAWNARHLRTRETETLERLYPIPYSYLFE